MPKPYVNFSEDEFLERQRRVRSELLARDLDGLLVSRVEDQHWLCGLDTDGFVIFHIMFIGSGGQLTHVSRTADIASIDYSSLCDDVRVWEDAEGNSKSKAIRDMLASHGMAGKRIGVQLDTFGLLPALHVELREALDGWCELVDASNLVRLMRLVKSPAELEHHRHAGRILDRACARAIELTAPGADEGHVLAEVYRIIWEEGADIPANRMPMGHGDKAMNVRYVTGRGSIGENDQVTFEMGDAWRHYHVADMFTVLTGPKIDPRHLKMHEACVEALDSVQAALRPGRTLGEVFEAHRATLAAHGFEHAILKACGYTMGRHLPAHLDGAADDLPRQPARARAEHGLLHAHDPERPESRPDHVAGGDVDHQEWRARSDHPCSTRGDHPPLKKPGQSITSRRRDRCQLAVNARLSQASLLVISFTPGQWPSGIKTC